MITYTGHLDVVCTTVQEFNKILTDAQTASTVSNIVSDVNLLTISFDLNTTS